MVSRMKFKMAVKVSIFSIKCTEIDIQSYICTILKHFDHVCINVSSNPVHNMIKKYVLYVRWNLKKFKMATKVENFSILCDLITILQSSIW